MKRKLSKEEVLSKFLKKQVRAIRQINSLKKKLKFIMKCPKRLDHKLSNSILFEGKHNLEFLENIESFVFYVGRTLNARNNE